MHGQVLATFVGLQSAEVLPEHDVSFTVMGILEEESEETEKRRRRVGGLGGGGERKIMV